MSTRMFQSRVLFVYWSMIILYLCSKVDGTRLRIEETMVPPNICTSPECINEAKTIYQNLNTSVAPCDNFFEFVCGGWSSSHPVKNEYTRNQYWELSHLNAARVRDILETSCETNKPEYYRKAKMFYKSCLKRDEHADWNFKIVKDRLDTWGGWPIAFENWINEKFDWRKLLIYLLRTNDLYPLFRIYVSLDYRNSSRATIMIDQADNKFCAFHESGKAEELVEIAIIKTARQIANATAQEVSDAKIKEDAAAVVRLEAQICKLRRKKKNRTDKTRFFTKTVRQLQNLTDEIEPINEYAKIVWLQLLNEYLQGSTVKIDEDEEVVVVEPNYISELMDLLDDVPQRTLANYMLWYHIEWMGADEWLEFLDHEMLLPENATRPSTKETRRKKCVQETGANFQHAIGYEYVKIYFDEDAKTKAREFVETLLVSLVEDLKNNEWMDGRTRTMAVEKAESTRLLIGYPDWYNTSALNEYYQEYLIEDNYIVNMENIKKISHRGYMKYFDGTDPEVDFWPQITDVNAYHYEANVIVVPAGILQAPFYVRKRPEALNYGAIGYIVGHELSHSFDVIGRKYDKTGSLRSWWSNETLKIHTVKKQCIEELFSAFQTPELAEEKAWRLDGPGTVGENMADIGGIELAHSAYKKHLRLHGPEKRLPGFTHYSSEQLFFIGYTTAQCETSTSEYVSAVILADEHTPNKYSAMITVANSKDFSVAWSCKDDDKMNSKNQCKFW